MQLPVGHTTRLSVHLLPLSPPWMLASLVPCSTQSAMHQQPLQDNHVGVTAVMVGWDGGMESWEEGAIPTEKKAFVQGKMSRLPFSLRRKMEMAF